MTSCHHYGARRKIRAVGRGRVLRSLCSRCGEEVSSADSE